MTTIEKKAWPETFGLFASGERKLELRLADFDLKTGDVIILKEYDPETKQYSGRQKELKCKIVEKSVRDPLQFYNPEDIKEHGLYMIEFE